MARLYLHHRRVRARVHEAREVPVEYQSLIDVPKLGLLRPAISLTGVPKIAMAVGRCDTAEKMAPSVGTPSAISVA